MNSPYLCRIVISMGNDGIVGASATYAVDSANPFTGQVRTDVGDPQPLDTGAVLTEVLGQAAVSALTHNSSLQASVAALSSQLAQCQDALSAADRNLQAARQQATQAEADAQTTLQAVQERVVELESRLTALQGTPPGVQE